MSTRTQSNEEKHDCTNGTHFSSISLGTHSITAYLIHQSLRFRFLTPSQLTVQPAHKTEDRPFEIVFCSKRIHVTNLPSNLSVYIHAKQVTYGVFSFNREGHVLDGRQDNVTIMGYQALCDFRELHHTFFSALLTACLFSLGEVYIMREVSYR